MVQVFQEEGDKIGSSQVIVEPIIEDVKPKETLFKGVTLADDHKNLIVEQPVVHAPEQKQKLDLSMLKQSTIEKIEFVDKLDLPENKMYKANMLQMMELGFLNFDLCLETL